MESGEALYRGGLIGFFEMTRFALGRLQFELMDFPESYEKTGHVRPEGMTKVINMHIPSCGPLKKEGCEASFRQAAAFFADAFPGEKIAFFCESWLLYPAPSRIFKPGFRNCAVYVLF